MFQLLNESVRLLSFGMRTDGKSFGFKGPWGLATPKKLSGDAFMVESNGKSLAYTSLPATGGHMAKMERLRRPVRALDPDVLARHKLLDNGQELWFSFFMVPSKGANDRSGFELFGEGISLGFSIMGQAGGVRVFWKLILLSGAWLLLSG